jgi:hypothetical protein
VAQRPGEKERLLRGRPGGNSRLHCWRGSTADWCNYIHMHKILMKGRQGASKCREVTNQAAAHVSVPIVAHVHVKRAF